MILNSEVDIAIINNPPSNRSLAMEPYRREPIVAFVPATHPLAKKENLTWHDIAQCPLIVRRPLAPKGTAEPLLQEIRKNGVTPNIVLHCDSTEAVKAAVSKKMGVGILYRDTIELELRNGQFKILNLPGGHNLGGYSFIVYRNNEPLSASARDFLELLRKEKHKASGRKSQSILQ